VASTGETERQVIHEQHDLRLTYATHVLGEGVGDLLQETTDGILSCARASEGLTDCENPPTKMFL
jgi:hypothetical protein